VCAERSTGAHMYAHAQAEPEITQITVDDSHELLLLASDGMWNQDNPVNFGFRSADEVCEPIDPKP
jgi:serine/threonine protein phosphatase PrpC